MRSTSPEPRPAKQPNHLAAFDLDGTLTEGGSVFPFLVAVAGLPKVLASSLLLAPQLALASIRGGSTADRVKQKLFRRVLAGRPMAEVISCSGPFGRHHLERDGRAHVLEALKRHQEAGHTVLLVSASPATYVEVIANELGVAHVEATHLAVDGEGRLTGRYEGANCRGEEKLARLERWREQLDEGHGVALWAYGNSRGDQRMLEAADHPVYVGKLGVLSPLRRFPRLSESPDPRSAT